MEKKVRIFDYKDNPKEITIKDFENVKEFVFEIISGDGTLTVVYNDNHEERFDSRYGTSSTQELEKILGDRYVCKINTKTKSRYYKIIAQNKNEYKKIQKNILVESQPFPKGDNTRYDMNIKGVFKELDKEKAQELDTSEVVQQLTLF